MLDGGLISEAAGLLSGMDLLYTAGGVLIGIIVAALPGLSGSIGVAILLPFTYILAPITSLAALGGLYAGAMYGGSISAILLNIPGCGAAVATAFDGYPMAQQGKAADALYASAFASFVGGVLGVVALTFLVHPLSRLSLKFGPVEYFWLAMLGISTLASLTAKNMAKGLMAGLIGIFLSLVGLDPLTGTDRFSFGIARLTSGVSIVPVIIAMFAVPQLLKFLEGQVMEIGPYTPRPQVGFQVAGTMLRRMKLLLLKSSVIGTIIGIVPGAGGYVASLVAYTEAKGSSAAPDEFGHGKMEGVVAAEAANSATAGGAIIPTLTFGIPGSNITAVLIGALMLHGFEPGPDLFLSQGPLLVAFIITLYFSYLVMLVFGAVGPKYFSLFLKVRSNYVVASFLVVSVIGTYSMSSNMIDVYLMLLLGLAGYVVQKVNIPLAPVVLGLILGPLAEKGLRHGLELGPLTGSVWGYFFLRPLSMVLIVLIVLFMTLPIYRARRRKAAALSRAEGECRAESHGAEKRKPMDFALAGVMTALSLAGLASLGDYTPEARIFPVFCFCGFLACSALLVAMNLGRKGWAGPDQGGWGGLPGVPWAKFGLVSVLYFLFVLGMPWIGFMASGTLFMLAVAYIADNEAAYKARPGATAARYVGFSILSAVAIYLVFIKTLNLDLPMRLMDYLFG